MFWRAVDIQLLSGASLFEGDISEGNIYCIAIQSIKTNILREIKIKLEKSAEFKKIASSQRFIENNSVAREPLVDAGRVDSNGILVGKTSNSRTALGTIQKENQLPLKADQPSSPAIDREKPASSHTARLPVVSSIGELLDFFLTRFGEKNKWQFWVTPEELCDIVEHCSDFIQVQWDEDSCGLSQDMTYIKLFNKGKSGENITLTGLFPFSTEIEAKEFCYNPNENISDLFGQLENLWGIKGKIATNFSGSHHSNWIDDENYERKNEIGSYELWPKICHKREALGIPSYSVEPKRLAKRTTALKELSSVQKTANVQSPTECSKQHKTKWWQFWR